MNKELICHWCSACHWCIL